MVHAVVVAAQIGPAAAATSTKLCPYMSQRESRSQAVLGCSWGMEENIRPFQSGREFNCVWPVIFMGQAQLQIHGNSIDSGLALLIYYV